MSEIKVSKLTNRAGTGAPNFSQGIKISGTASTLLAPTRTEEALSASSDWTISLSDVSYDSVSFSVATQSGNPTGAVFNHDGTKIYVISPAGDTIYQYGLSTAYDLSTASYDNKSFGVGTQESVVYGLGVNDDTTKVYIVGSNSDNIHEYDLSTASDISTASYNSVSLDISSQEASSRVVTFNNDGTKLFLIGTGSDSVYQYNLTTAYDLSTASYASSSFSVASQTGTPQGLKFNPDGTQMFVISNDQYVYQYSLTTGYDLSTASYDSVTFYTNAFETQPQDIFFSADGTKMFICGSSGDKIYQLSTGATAPASEPANPSNGDTWWNPTDETYDVYINDEWKRFIGASSGGGFSWGGDRGVFYGNSGGSDGTQIQYVDITSAGNASDFGDLIETVQWASGASDSSRGVIMGGEGQTNTETIQYFTFSTLGNTSDFGDLSVLRTRGAGVGDGTYGVNGGGNNSIGQAQNVLEYITIQTLGNSADFGDFGATYTIVGAGNDSTRGVWGAGQYSGSNSNTMEYITIASTGNATDFGDLTAARFGGSGTGDTTYVLFSGGYTTTQSNIIDYITTQTTGNATDFGDLVEARRYHGSTSNGTTAIFGGGQGSSANTNSIDQVTIATTGNASDFGDLTEASQRKTGSSGAAS